MASLYFSLLLLTFLLLLSPSLGEIRFSHIQNDNRPFIPIDHFGFTHSGHLQLNVTKISLSDHNLDLSKVGFFLCTLHSWRDILHQIEDHTIFCPLNSRLVHVIYTFNSLNSQNYFNKDYASKDKDEYHLFFANCHEQNLNVSMSVRSSMYNLDPQNGVPNYLSAGKEDLPSLYVFFFFVYYEMALCLNCLLKENRSIVSRIHFFMLPVVILKALNILSQAAYEWYIEKNGSAYGWNGWNVLLYFFSFLQRISFFSVIVLIGCGWSFLKPRLQVKEMVVLMIAISLQVVAYIAHVVVHETGPYRHDWVGWNKIFMLADVICWCVVLFPIWGSIRNLHESARTGGRPSVILKKMRQFKHFFWVLVFYFYITRAVVYNLELMFFYNHSMLSLMCAELPTQFFYVYTGFKFWPEAHNPIIDDQEEEAAAKALKLEPECKV